jgi:CBS domain-containing protein
MPTTKILEARTTGTQSEVPRHPRVETLTVKSVLKERPSPICCVEADVASLDALKLMAKHDIGAVMVLDGGRAIGIFSEREYVRHSARVAQLAVTAPVHETMMPCDISVTTAASAQECLNLMNEKRLRHLPVQEAGKLIAMLSLDDLLSEIVAHHERVFRASEQDRQILFLRGTYSC